ncbi:hypothetical protein SLEP1_g52965 [Rubroshorea leprosula]|uniref:Cation efflux protein transmembrane domain-containing protein n=1 Tax=Rubroshorea leprosula TaxID=152421 RepID=A0AAV5MA80_9ROSI|nr:hypothetical protein SLEP1_g52965 [Rubroshorea leprosula]
MEGESGYGTKTPLLSGSGRRSGLFRRKNSVNTLRKEFLLRLQEKVRCGVDDESPFHIDVSKTKGLTKGEKEYYEKQFATLKSFEEVDALDPSTQDVVDENEQDEEQIQQKREQIEQERAMKISNYANIVLLILKIYATITSGCIVIAASTLDSFLELMARSILWFAYSSMKDVNIYKYPIGKLRVQPLGIILFAAVMAMLGLQVLIQALEELIKDEPSEKMSSNQLIWLYAIMITAIGVKLALWLYCRTSRNMIVRAHAEDHDVVTNLVGLVAAVLGDKICWWIDPAGAIAVALYTIINWSGNVMENARQSAPPDFLQKVTYLVIRHPLVKRIHTVRAYTSGVLYFVEVSFVCDSPFVALK